MANNEGSAIVMFYLRNVLMSSSSEIVSPKVETSVVDL